MWSIAAHETQHRGHDVELLHYVADLAPQRAVGRVHEAYDVVVAGVGAGHGCEFFGRYMIGHEYKNRAPEPLFAAETFEKEAECVVVVSRMLKRRSQVR